MDPSSAPALAALESGNKEEVERVLQGYNRQNSRTFTFDQSEEEERKKMCDEILKTLQKDLGPSCQATCLETIRILSRDKKILAPLTTRPAMLALMRLAGLEYAQSSKQEISNFNVIIEALKCLCNIVFNSEKAQQLSVDFKLVSGACERLKTHRDKNLPHEIKFFDLRLLFLLSALRMDARAQLKEEQGLLLLTDILESTLDVKWSHKYVVATDCRGPPLSNEQVDISVELLKALFNVTYDCNQQQIDEDRAHQNRHLAAILCHCLLLKTQSEDKTEEFHSHTVNLLNNIPASSLDLLFSPSIKCGTVEYNGKKMDAVEVLLGFMENRIDKGSNLKEGLTPVLSVLTECCRTHRDMRKYIRSRVLPPLKDVKHRPEIGTTLRNKLVRLMTHIDTGVKHTSAEFLFVLCKESVDCLLKYTGYGNAAGLLAAHGLLAGGRGDGQYSEDEDTDTEEYKSVKSFINPITGHVEDPMPNPMDGMTEEQKEYEAMKLVNMFDKLSREQIIKPMRVKPDGTMGPLEEAANEYTSDHNSTSDSDENI
ncbi:synembryn-B isoform X1 [Stegostoma tigrinum]|uniref:synembryn-B isoform X1 n=2 Tax=Stegostoma tigrinum TaxID=3053191 RepID=UPI00202B01B8|nr:synembryn-B isoform X1 [Stegostoma tigrinum]